MPAPFRFDRTWVFPTTTEELWRTISSTTEFSRWWPWLRELETDGFRAGATALAVIRAPLPYTLRVRIEVRDVVEGALVDTTVHGDLCGPARLEIAPHDHGSAARLVWSLELRSRLLAPLGLVARPVLGWAHDQIVTQGVRQFERRGLRA